MRSVSLFVSAAIFLGFALVGTHLKKLEMPPPSPPNLLDEARTAVRLGFESAEIKEVHILSKQAAVCGLVMHDRSEAGWTPFAFSRQLGLSVAKVWGRNQPENLNSRYGCHFLPLAYSEEWKTPFWGGDSSERYIAASQTL